MGEFFEAAPDVRQTFELGKPPQKCWDHPVLQAVTGLAGGVFSESELSSETAPERPTERAVRSRRNRGVVCWVTAGETRERGRGQRADKGLKQLGFNARGLLAGLPRRTRWCRFAGLRQ